jgi:hypothetical protein
MDEFDSEETNESGGSLRAKLEQSLKSGAELAAEVAKYRAKDLISDKGLQYVTPEDLAGVGLNELETKALELEGVKKGQQEAAVRQAFKNKGLTGDELDRAVQELLGPPSDTEAATDRIRQVGKIQGLPPNRNDDTDLFGPSRIRAAFGSK